MSAIVCGKRSFLEDIESSAGNSNSPTSAIGPVYKKFRCHSPVRLNQSPPVHQDLVDQLVGLFPDLETQFLEKALEDSGNDVDSAIKSLQELQHAYAKCNPGSTAEEMASVDKGETPTAVEQVRTNLPVDGSEWIDLFVREMSNATSIDDARSRAANILENLEKSISSQVSAEATQNYHKENVMMREQIEMLLRDNVILKRAVAIQHERQKEYDEKNQEVHQLKQLVAQYQEQMRNLEVSNYALSMHLRQAQQINTLPGRFHPDVF